MPRSDAGYAKVALAIYKAASRRYNHILDLGFIIFIKVR